jgi:outer membrane protein assembly factor BamB
MLHDPARHIVFRCFLLALPAVCGSAAATPVERELRQRFPAIERLFAAQATFEATDAGWLARAVDAPPPGLTPEQETAWRTSTATWRAALPERADGTFVVEGEGVRVAWRRLGAVGSRAEIGASGLAYAGIARDTDALHAAGPGRSEEILLLRSPEAPTRFEYELTIAGASRVALEGGAFWALGGAGRGLVLSPPVVLDADGRRSTQAARWELGAGDARGVRRLTLRLDPSGLAYPLAVDPAWILTGSPGTAHSNDATAALLQDGRVLLISGPGAIVAVDGYDPASGLWSVLPSLAAARVRATATLLRDGRLLLVGGFAPIGGAAFSQCLLFDPATNTWSTTGPLLTARGDHAATLLPDGRVLVTGGRTTIAASAGLGNVEIYDPSTGTWSNAGTHGARYGHSATLFADGRVMLAAGANSVVLRTVEIAAAPYASWAPVASMIQVRLQHSATLLPDGRVLVAGGSSATGEVYDPVANTWTSAGALAVAHQSHTATLLPTGKVLVAGGNGGGSPLTEVFDPATNTFSAGVNLNSARTYHNAVLLPNGRVLVAGGFSSVAITTAELYDNDAGAWQSGVPLGVARSGHSATPLLDGRVLVAGGDPALASAEVYVGGAWTPTGNLVQGREEHTATLLGDGRVLVVGGESLGTDLASAELFDPGPGTWSTTGAMADGRRAATATLLPCGEVLVAGGESSGTPLRSAEIFNPLSGRWRPAAPMAIGRFSHAATLLRDGRVLVTGGMDPSGLSSAEVYDPTLDAWTTVPGGMSVARAQHTSTLLAAGRVLLAAGRVLVAGEPFGGGPGASAEVFNPVTFSFSATGGMITRRKRHAATLLPNGKVLIEGGSITGVLGSAELYDSTTGTWSATGGLTPRESHTSTLLPNGRVLATGGSNGGPLGTSQEYDVGRGETPAWRPNLVSVTNPLVSGSALAATGGGWRGISEASTGNGPRQSATNYPLVQLRRLDNEALSPTLVDPAVGWSDTTFRSRPLAGLMPGPAFATVFTNGIPSGSRALRVECPAAVFASDPSPQTVCQGETVVFTASVNDDCAVYKWRRGGTPLSDGGPISGSDTTTLSVGPMTPALAGTYDVQARRPCGSATSTSASALLTLTPQPPTFAGVQSVAPIGGTCGFRLQWSAAGATCGSAGAALLRYNVYRSTTPGFTPSLTTLVAACVGPTFYNDMAGVASGTTYYYVVRAEDGTSGFGGLCGDGVEETNVVQLAGTIGGACSPGTAPTDVVPLTGRARSGETRLEWVNPTLGPYGSTVVRYRTDVTPSGPSDGTPVATVGGAPGQVMSVDHGGLTDGTTYHYAAFVDNGFGSFSTGAAVSGRPDTTAGAFRWAFSTQAASLSPPGVLPSGAYFIVSNDRFLHSMRSGSSGGSWPAAWLPLSAGAPSKGRPVVANLPTTTVGGAQRIALIGALDGRVYAVNADTGAPLWISGLLGSAISAAPAAMFTDAGGSVNLVLIGTRETGGDSVFHGLRLADGSPAWTFTNGGGGSGIGIISGQARVDYATNRVFFTSRRNPSGSADTVWCLSFNGVSATKLWSSPLPGDIDASPVLFNGTLYVGNVAGEVWAFDPATGTPKWASPYGAGDGPVKGFIFPVGGPTRLYFSTTARVHAILDNGSLAAPYWSAPVGVPSPSAPVVVSGRVYVGGGASRLYSIDANAITPPLPTSVELGDPLVPKVIGAPTYDTLLNLLLAGSDLGTIYAVQAPF